MQRPQIQIPDVYKPLFLEPKRKNLIYGGRGSAKSHTVARFCISRASQKTIRVLCTRELQKSIAESVHSLLVSCIEEMGLSSFFTVQRDRIIGINGSVFLFTGVRSNVQEIKSMEGIDICWVEEAQAMTQQSLDVLIPTIRKDGSILIFTFNPFKDTDPVYKLAVNPTPDCLVIKANHSENPFFPDELKKEMEQDKKNDYDKYLWVWEGECLGLSEAQIFRGKYEVKDFVTPDGALCRYGADWGFSKDPTTLIRSFIIGNTLYIDQEAYEIGCDISATPELFNQIEGSRLHTIYADNSRPETISAMQNYGFNVQSAEKWSGSIEDGIAFIRSFDKIVIHPRCKQTIEEFELYQYKVDRVTNEITRSPVDRFNHCIDALRYSLTTIMRASSRGKVYDKLTVNNIKEVDYKFKKLYVATMNMTGLYLCCGAVYTNNAIHIVLDVELKGSFDFNRLKTIVPNNPDIVWMPLDTVDTVAQKSVQECIDAGIEPAVPSILPSENEGVVLVNRLFESGALRILPSSFTAINALTEAVFTTEDRQNKNSSLYKETLWCKLIEYLVWRVMGRVS